MLKQQSSFAEHSAVIQIKI